MLLDMIWHHDHIKLVLFVSAVSFLIFSFRIVKTDSHQGVSVDVSDLLFSDILSIQAFNAWLISKKACLKFMVLGSL